MSIPRGVKWGCIFPVVLIVALVGLLFLADAIIPSEARKALPKSATHVQEYYLGSIDFVRLVKADLPRSDYFIYAENLNLSESFSSAKHEEIRQTLNIGIGDAPSWWTPPSANSLTFFDHVKGDDYLQVLHYDGTTAYFAVISW